MGKPLFVLLVIAGAWYGWNEFGRVDGAYSNNGEPLALLFTTGQCGEACDSMRRHLKTRVVMHVTEWCGYCRKAREYFVANNIEFTEYDIEKDRKAKRDYDVLKGSGTPLVYQGYTRVVGFNRRQIEKTFDL